MEIRTNDLVLVNEHLHLFQMLTTLNNDVLEHGIFFNDEF